MQITLLLLCFLLSQETFPVRKVHVMMTWSQIGPAPCTVVLSSCRLLVLSRVHPQKMGENLSIRIGFLRGVRNYHSNSQMIRVDTIIITLYQNA